MPLDQETLRWAKSRVESTIMPVVRDIASRPCIAHIYGIEVGKARQGCRCPACMAQKAVGYWEAESWSKD